MLHLDTPLSFAILSESCRIWEQSTVSHPKKFCQFSLYGNTNFHRMFLIWSKYLSIMETTGWYLSIGMCFVLVHCCVGMLMTSCYGVRLPFWDAKELRYYNLYTWNPCPGHNSSLPSWIWIIFHTLIVYDPRIDLDTRSYLQGQSYSTHIPKIRIRAITPHCQIGFG